MKKSSKEDLVIKLYYDTLANPSISQILENCKNSNFKKSMIAYFFVIDKDEMLSCMEPEALKSRE